MLCKKYVCMKPKLNHVLFDFQAWHLHRVVQLLSCRVGSRHRRRTRSRTRSTWPGAFRKTMADIRLQVSVSASIDFFDIVGLTSVLWRREIKWLKMQSVFQRIPIVQRFLTVVNVTNVIRANFLDQIILTQKSIQINFKYKKAAHKMLVKLTPFVQYVRNVEEI